jgi:LmeA-like phospholipid-binding
MTDTIPSARWRRRQRIVLEAVALALGTVLLLWGADRLAEIGAESLLERNIQDVTGVVERPDVDVRGPLFLPQAIRGAYGEVRVSVSDLRSGPLTIKQVDATLHDVRMPFKDVLLRDIRRVGVGQATDQVTLRFQDLNAYFETTGQSLRLTGTDDGQVEMSGYFIVLGQTVHATAGVDLQVDGSQLRIAPREIDTGDTVLDSARRLLLNQRLGLTIPLDTLPFGTELTEVSVDADELRISATSSAIILRP